jgi:hypothetical protein
MRRIIKIILILLAVFLITLGVIWLIGRHAAQKNGKTPLSFRQFLGLSTKLSPASTIPGGTDTSLFNGAGGTGDGTGGAGGDGSTSGTGRDGSFKGGAGRGFNDNTRTSQFTNRGFSLTNGTNNGFQTSGSTSTTGDGKTGDTADTTTTTDTSSANNKPICSTADTTISFTADELTQLNLLQNRFYAIAQSLHTDADVATEIANHDAFAVKADQVTELYNYCESKLPAITDPRLQQHVATPFWNDSSKDSLSFIDFSQLNAAHLAAVHDSNTGDSDSNGDTSGIKGPYGLLNFSTPTAVAVTGSVLKVNSVSTGPLGILLPPDPLHIGSGPLPPGSTTTTTGADFQLLIPVVEKILRINLW